MHPYEIWGDREGNTGVGCGLLEVPEDCAQPRRTVDIDALNDAGDEGWELAAILSNNIAYLKRKIEAEGRDAAEDEERAAEEAPTILSAAPAREQDEPRSEVKPKYRDPVTGETRSGRGRMARWLKRKQDAGEEIERYRV
jgi:DNA-binding protein H-NS